MRHFGKRWRALAVGALVVGLAALHPAGVRAATATVSSCDQTDLQTAINNAGAGGTVNFQCSGTITLTSTITPSGSLTIDGSGQSVTISGGSTSPFNGVEVFAVYSGVTVTLNDLTIANGNGGIYNEGTLTVSNSTFNSNSAYTGGGIYNDGTLTVSNSTFNNNSAASGEGGGIANYGAVTVSNSTFSDNSAGALGGGIYNGHGDTATVSNSTFSGNSATDGGGIYNYNASAPAGTVNLANTILAGTISGDCAGNPITDNGGNLADDSSCTGTSSAGLAGTLGPLQNNGGPTDTIALLAGSPAIKAGLESVCQGAPVSGLDQRGDARRTTTCDSGAYDTGDPTPAIAVTVSGGQTYGAASPSFTPAYTAPNGVSVSGSVSCTTVNGGTAINPSLAAAGSYTIDGTNCSGLSATGYTFTYTGGSFVVSPAPLTMTASSPTITYGGTALAITAGFSGLVGGDTTTSEQSKATCAATPAAPVNAGSYPTSCTLNDANYSPTYVAGILTINPASQAISFAALPNQVLGAAPFTVSATGGGSGNPVAFSAGPSTVCTASGANGATITLVGVGACTVTANQAGNANYQAATPVPQSFQVSNPRLTATLAFSSSPAGPVTTGSVVTASFSLGNHTTASQKVSVTVTLTYTGSKGSLSLSVPLALTLQAGQTVSKSASFTITKLFPRGTYALNVAAKDGSGDTASASASLTVV